MANKRCWLDVLISDYRIPHSKFRFLPAVGKPASAFDTKVYPVFVCCITSDIDYGTADLSNDSIDTRKEAANWPPHRIRTRSRHCFHAGTASSTRFDALQGLRYQRE